VARASIANDFADMRLLATMVFTAGIWACSPSLELVPSAEPARETQAERATIEVSMEASSSPGTEVPPSATPIICPAPANVVPFELPTSQDQLVYAVSGYLNAGGDPSRIAGLLDDPSGDVIQSSQLVMADANADGYDDVILSVSIFDQDYGGVPFYPIGAIYIFHCKNGRYFSQVTELGGYIWDIKVSAIEDLTGDGLPELVIAYTWAGSSCVDHTLIMGWSATKWKYYLQAGATCQAEAIILDLDNNGFKEIALAGYTRGSGALRAGVWTYAFNGDEFELVSEELLPSSTRIHVLQDAQIALDKGNLVEAAQLYMIAAVDKGLVNSPSFYEMRSDLVDLAGPYQAAFASFRSAALWVHLDARANADFIQAHLRSGYIPGEPGSEFIDLLDRLLRQLDDGATLGEACAAIESYAQEEYPNLAGNDGHLGEFGSSNVGYLHDDLCPFE